MKPSRKPVPKEHAVRDLLAGPCGLDAGSAARQPPVAAVAEGRSLRVTECFTLFASEPAGRAAEPPQERDDSRETENRPGGGGALAHVLGCRAAGREGLPGKGRKRHRAAAVLGPGAAARARARPRRPARGRNSANRSWVSGPQALPGRESPAAPRDSLTLNKLRLSGIRM